MIPACDGSGRRMQRRRGGFSMLEFVLVVFVIGVLATVAINRFLFYQERTEKIAMESTLALVKMGLQLRLAEMMMGNRQSQAVELERENPMKWLDPPPANYAGEYSAPIKTGNWYYASAERELVYVPASTAFLDIAQSGSKELRYRVAIQTGRNEVTGQPMPIGVGVVASRSYKWF
jgi:prepilin-type N-terminal cleavage/methylation domain-containing protein